VFDCGSHHQSYLVDPPTPPDMTSVKPKSSLCRVKSLAFLAMHFWFRGVDSGPPISLCHFFQRILSRALLSLTPEELPPLSSLLSG